MFQFPFPVAFFFVCIKCLEIWWNWCLCFLEMICKSKALKCDCSIWISRLSFSLLKSVASFYFIFLFGRLFFSRFFLLRSWKWRNCSSLKEFVLIHVYLHWEFVSQDQLQKETSFFSFLFSFLMLFLFVLIVWMTLCGTCLKASQWFTMYMYCDAIWPWTYSLGGFLYAIWIQPLYLSNWLWWILFATFSFMNSLFVKF